MQLRCGKALLIFTRVRGHSFSTQAKFFEKQKMTYLART